jgi:hypothetical protein
MDNQDKKWFRFEVLYKKVNPLSYERKNKVYTTYQSAYKSNQNEAKEHAIKCFECQNLGDELISITLIN